MNIMFDEIINELVEGNDINIEDFGKLNKYNVNEHTGINTGTGEKIVIETHNRVKFAASPTLKKLFSSEKINTLLKLNSILR